MSYSFKLCRYFCHFFPLVSKEILKQWWEYRDSKNKECWLRINIQKIRHNDEVNMKKRTSTMTVNFRSCKNKLATLIWQPYLIKCEMWILSLRCEEGKVELFPFFFCFRVEKRSWWEVFLMYFSVTVTLYLKKYEKMRFGKD